MKTFQWPLKAEQCDELNLADLVTFDLFETLVYRINNKKEQFKVYGPIGIYLRRFFEFSWRISQKCGLTKDFKLTTLERIFGSKINDEFEIDLKQLVPRMNLVELLLELNARNMRVEVVTNSYYTEQQIRKVCRKLGIPDSVKLNVSSEEGITKKMGLFQKSNTEKFLHHWHFGDDLKEDGAVSDDVFVFVPKIWERLPRLGGKYCLQPKKSIINERLMFTYSTIVADFQDEQDEWFWFGVLYAGPIGISIGQKLVKLAHELEIDYIYFLARDGYLPYKYLQSISTLEIRYLPYSRKISDSAENIKKLETWIKLDSGVSKKMIFDLGWRGRSASKLSLQVGNSAALVLFGRWPWSRRLEDTYLFFGPKRTLAKALKIRRCPELVEIALSAPHTSLENLPPNLDHWLEEFELNHSLVAHQIARGALEFQTNWLNGGNASLPIGQAIKPLNNLMNNPTKSFLSLASKLTHDFEGKQVPLVSVGNEPVTFWIKGNWRFQKNNNIPMRVRLRYFQKEWLRRLRFRN